MSESDGTLHKQREESGDLEWIDFWRDLLKIRDKLITRERDVKDAKRVFHGGRRRQRNGESRRAFVIRILSPFRENTVRNGGVLVSLCTFSLPLLPPPSLLGDEPK